MIAITVPPRPEATLIISPRLCSMGWFGPESLEVTPALPILL